ncbi:hypothetical protein [uncultured Pantoea sp.]|uniref:hypothetical protein n=1 Tax=uncultured Pantoea sp. TaxID=218084 RepID=UPI0026009D15|nr:hypothetical protein [uncultured Pantoea sp.]
MLENYYPSGLGSSPATPAQKQRLVAVQAALEIAKAGAASSGVTHSLDSLVNDISRAADAIQAALQKSAS